LPRQRASRYGLAEEQRLVAMNKGNLIFAALFAAAFAYIVFGRGPVGATSAPYEGRPELVAATFSSAWCSSCKVLKPRLAAVIPDFADKPVKFVELDFSFSQYDEAKAIADANGFEDVYEHAKGATGFTVLIDRDTGKIIDTLTMKFSEKAMRQAIAAALAVAETTTPVDATDEKL
jgi:thiol-disulfide isomerase/thioredoxin